MNIYVGNLSYQTGENELRAAFEKHGEVSRVNVVSDRDTGQPRGFAFVEMPVNAEAQAAIAALNGTEMNGRELNVNEARPRTDNKPSGGGGGRRSNSGSGSYNRRY